MGAETAASAEISDRFADDVCDTTGGEESSFYTSSAEDQTVFSVAERVCGGWKGSLEATLESEASYRQGYQDSLSVNLSSEGIGVSDFRYERVDLGLGEKALAYRISATLIGSGVTVSYEAYEVSQFTDLMATTLIMEAYGRGVDQNELKRLASVINARAVAAG